VQGLETDLGLVGTQFNTAISILFVGYILGQIPSNLILSRVRPSLYLSGFVALWGAVSMATALADNYTHLLVIRFFLGVTESPYFPGALFLLSSWYPKKVRSSSGIFMTSLTAHPFSAHPDFAIGIGCESIVFSYIGVRDRGLSLIVYVSQSRQFRTSVVSVFAPDDS
jgi:MFS family permease